ncbi:MAG: alpha/beta hydrolase, partial [Firmicutes bacterium]|nr:alpha/beta hydrolase [Bacillota bacterium]
PIVFLHGWGAGADSFAPISRFFSSRTKCVMIDFDCNPKKVMTLEDYVEVVEEQITKEKLSHFDIVAHSFGCRVAAILVARNPHMVRRLVLTGAAGLRPKFSIVKWSRIRIYKTFKIGKGSSDYRKLSRTGKRTFQNIIHRDLSYEVSLIKSPTLLIFGSKDKSTPPYMARRWAKLQKNAVLKIYSRAGHYAFLDDTPRFINDVFNFLEVEKC